MQDRSSRWAFLFPLLLAVVAAGSVLVVNWALDLKQGPVGDALSARLTWGIAAMLFLMFFAFTVVACNIVMFRCGAPQHAMFACVVTTVVGLLATLVWTVFLPNTYLGPPTMKRYLDATAFCVGHVRTLTALLDGLATWAAVLVVATSGVILANEVEDPGDLSRQLRGSKILMYCAAALLITGVSAVGALHKWPGHETAPVSQNCTNTDAQQMFADPNGKKKVDSTAVAVSTTIGTVASLILAAAYLPLAIVLRQRAYRVVKPWERTETWLAVHGFALQPTQQLAKLFLILSPLMAGGPVSYLITLLSG